MRLIFAIVLSLAITGVAAAGGNAFVGNWESPKGLDGYTFDPSGVVHIVMQRYPGIDTTYRMKNATTAVIRYPMGVPMMVTIKADGLHEDIGAGRGGLFHPRVLHRVRVFTFKKHPGPVTVLE